MKGDSDFAYWVQAHASGSRALALLERFAAALAAAAPTAPHICANHDESLDEAYRKGLSDATPTAGAGGLDVERLHKMLGTEGEGVGVWVHRPEKDGDWTSPEGRFHTFRVEDVHATIDRWAALAPVAHRPTPAESDPASAERSLTQREVDLIFDGALGERRAESRDTQAIHDRVSEETP